MSTAVDNKNLGKAIGRIATGVYVVTLDHNGIRDGMLATWLIQQAFTPPLITVAINKERQILEAFAEGKVFAVNVLAKTNNDIFKAFVKPYQEGMNRFEGLALLDGVQDVAVFKDCVAYFKCRVTKQVDAGDHITIFGEALDGDMVNPDAEPMVHLRNNGFQY